MFTARSDLRSDGEQSPCCWKLRKALQKDPYCFEAFELLVKHQMLTASEERSLLDSLPLTKNCRLAEMEVVQSVYETILKKVCEVNFIKVSGCLDKFVCILMFLSHLKYFRDQVGSVGFFPCLSPLWSLVRSLPQTEAFLCELGFSVFFFLSLISCGICLMQFHDSPWFTLLTVIRSVQWRWSFSSLPFTSVVPSSKPASDRSIPCGLGFRLFSILFLVEFIYCNFMILPDSPSSCW